MAFPTVRQLILSASYLIGEFDPQNPPPGADINEALNNLNDIINSFNGTGLMSPYDHLLIFDMQKDKGTYVVSTREDDDVDISSGKIVELKDGYVKFQDVDTTYPLRRMTKSDWYSTARALNTSSIPLFMFFQNNITDSILNFYPLPDQNYQCTLRVKRVISNVELDDVLDEVPEYYIRFLKYALAREMSQIYETSNWSDLKEGEYINLKRDIEASNDKPDLSIVTDYDSSLVNGARLRAGIGG